MEGPMPRSIKKPMLEGLAATMVLSVFGLLSAPMAIAAPSVETEQSSHNIPFDMVTLNSDILAQPRNAMIHVPEPCLLPGMECPTLYVLDGDYHLEHILSTTRFMADRDFIPHTIVVAVTNPDRDRFLTPTPVERIENSGSADRFLRFLEQELIPHVDARYSTNGYRILAGHSYGGLFVTNALAMSPDLFGGYIAVSPSVHWDGGYVIDRLAEQSFGEDANPRLFYFTMGTLERDEMTNATSALAETLSSMNTDHLTWHYDLMEGADHDSTQLLSFYNGLAFIFSGWLFDFEGPAEQWTLENLESDAAAFTARTGYPNTISDWSLMGVGRAALRRDYFDAALEVFDRAVELYPANPNFAYWRGQTQWQLGDLAAARENLQRAISIADEFGNVPASDRADLESALDAIDQEISAQE